MKKSEIYQTVTDQIIAQLESVDPKDYDKPWFSQGLAPVNLRGNAYRGINHMLLSYAGYSSNVWGTFKQWKEKGCNVVKGEKSHMVVLWKFFKGKKEDESDDDEESFQSVMVRYYRVFNSNQIDGDFARKVEDKQKIELNRHDPIVHAEKFIYEYLKAENVNTCKSDRACYVPIADSISMPDIGQFKTPEHYYSVYAHEIAHSTGKDIRLNRDLNGRFGDSSYAFEELIAELSSAMVCSTLGIESKPRVDHAQYIKSWLNALNDDNSFIISAASQAQKASDYALQYVNEKKEKIAA